MSPPQGSLKVALFNAGPIRLAVEFDCAPGELVALVGPSGSGKTSVLRAVAGLLRAPGLRGRVSVGDQTWFDSAGGINLSPQRRRVGLVFQHYALFGHLSALENVALAARFSGATAGQASTRALQALFERLGLAALQDRRPAQLSGGQQQRVALARALVRVAAPQIGLAVTPGAQTPGALLLDEPFSAVDAPTRHSLYRELASLRQSLATPMLLVTHDLAEARRLADRVVIVDAGESLQTGTPAHVFASPRNARVADLVGIQNHFEGRFHPHSPGRARLIWGAGSGALALWVADKGKIPDGAAVTWVIAGDQVEVQPDGEGQSPAPEPLPENRLPCTLVEMLALGEISLCVLAPEHLPQARVTLNLPSAQLRHWALAPGRRLWLRIAPSAVHIMPVRASEMAGFRTL